MEIFRFDDAREMNPYWIYKTLSDNEKYVCCALVREGGPLGMSEEDMAVAQIELSEVEGLVECGIVRKAPLFQMAEELIKDENFTERMARLRDEGGFFAAEDESDGLLFASFETAEEIVQGGDVEGNSTIYYQVSRKDLYGYLEILL